MTLQEEQDAIRGKQGTREGTDGHWESLQDVPGLGDIRGDTQGCRRRRRKTMPPVGTGDIVENRHSGHSGTSPGLGTPEGTGRHSKMLQEEDNAIRGNRGQGRGRTDS